MKSRVLQCGGVGVLIAVLGLAGVPSSLGKAEAYTLNDWYPISIAGWADCANGGAGEWVFVEGMVHELIHVTVDNNGGTLMKAQHNPQQFVGIGSVTGDIYQVSGNDIYIERSSPNGFPIEGTYQTSLRLIGKGTGSNAWVHIHLHITVNANGEITSELEQIDIGCK